MSLIIVTSVMSALNSPTSAANDSDVCDGEWHGFIDVSTSDIAFTINLRRIEDGRCAGTISIPDQDLIDAALQEVIIENNAVSFVALSHGKALNFRAILANSNQELDGQLKQDRFTLPFKLARGTAQLFAREEVRALTLKDVSGLPSDRASLVSTDDPAIQYSTRPSTDAVAELNRKIDEGVVQLEFKSPQGYLRSTLEALGIAADTQMMVFSKTSVQARLINPANPRALFFNDAVTVGYIRNAPFLEFAAVDPEQGVIFYTLDQQAAAKPQFVRRNSCLACHLSRNTIGVPG
ncbi:MAG TPA: hypothetical protein VET48_03990, partial [Steroidobacteraceae bacterium]|nr:hypothetical protein [Steroidobacteraceae bacterium]